MAEAQGKLSVAAAKELLKGNPDGLREVVRAVLREVLEAEMTEALGAAKGERSVGRLGYRAGYCGRTPITRVGKLELRVPQDRDGSRPSCSSATSAPSRRSWRRWPRCTSRASRPGR